MPSELMDDKRFKLEAWLHPLGDIYNEWESRVIAL